MTDRTWSAVPKRLAQFGALTGSIVFGFVLTNNVAGAHETTHCYHGDIPNGAWLTQYQHHFDHSGKHWNYYFHYYNTAYQHTETNHCGSA